MLERAGNKKDTVTTEGGELRYRIISANQLSTDLEEKNRNNRKGNYAGGKWYSAYTIYFLMK